MTVSRSDIGFTASVAISPAISVAIAVVTDEFAAEAIAIAISAVISIAPAIARAVVVYGEIDGFLLLLFGGEDGREDDCEAIRHWR
jgi:hypothetical protein